MSLLKAITTASLQRPKNRSLYSNYFAMINQPCLQAVILTVFYTH